MNDRKLEETRRKETVNVAVDSKIEQSGKLEQAYPWLCFVLGYSC